VSCLQHSKRRFVPAARDACCLRSPGPASCPSRFLLPLQYDDEVRRLTDPDASSEAEAPTPADDSNLSEGFESVPRSDSSEAEDAADHGSAGTPAPQYDRDPRLFPSDSADSEPASYAEVRVASVVVSALAINPSQRGGLYPAHLYLSSPS